MIIALEINREINLLTFSRYLAQNGVMHRIVESGAKQILSVRTEEDKSNVVKLYESYLSGEMQLIEQESVTPAKKSYVAGLLIEFFRAPLVMTILLANLICFPITMGTDTGEFTEWFHLFTFLDFKVFGDKLYFADLNYTFSSGQYWRLLSPMFLHFGWMHIVFNALWIWEIGKRIEHHSGASILFLLVIVSSLTANLTQYWMSGAGLFGGMSGVVFGLLAYALCWHLASSKLFFSRHAFSEHAFSKKGSPRDLGLPKGIYIFMLAYLAIGFTGAIDLLGIGSLANGAHLGGLIGGLFVGVTSVAISFYFHRRRNLN
ncbi:MAG: rhomboid family intramembrane serine protease [Pseudomonadales bacterium]|nr:rhomboid family intramembrane serine protease [Pseudomonadales bacterium]